jgi:transposase-like protein
MATRQQFTLSQEERRRRVFSEEFKKKKVKEIERKETTVSEISRIYEVRSWAVRLWIKKYGLNSMKKERLVVESESDTIKIKELQSRIADLERLVGQKEVQLIFNEKLIEIAEATYGIEIKKKFGIEPSSGSGKIEKS